jgi:hypothetical protein
LAVAFEAIGKLKKEDRYICRLTHCAQGTDRKASREITFLEGEAGVYCVAALIGRLQKKEDVMYARSVTDVPLTLIALPILLS